MPSKKLAGLFTASALALNALNPSFAEARDRHRHGPDAGDVAIGFGLGLLGGIIAGQNRAAPRYYEEPSQYEYQERYDPYATNPGPVYRNEEQCRTDRRCSGDRSRQPVDTGSRLNRSFRGQDEQVRTCIGRGGVEYAIPYNSRCPN